MSTMTDISARETVARLLDELPPDAIVAKYLNGQPPYTAEMMAKEVREGTSIGQQYAADLLRVSRDFLRREAKRWA